MANALAETTIGLYKTEKIQHEGPGITPAEFEQTRWNNNTQVKLPL